MCVHNEVTNSHTWMYIFAHMELLMCAEADFYFCTRGITPVGIRTIILWHTWN